MRTISTPIENQDARIARILRQVPLTDGHNDLPWESRQKSKLAFDEFDLTQWNKTRHTDIPRLRAGGVGAQFWSVYVPVTFGKDEAVTATLEQIDFVRRMLARYPDVFEFARGPEDAVRIHRAGKIASMVGVEGGHQTGGSLGVLRQLYALGAHYMTLAHATNSPFADSATDQPEYGGLSEAGRKAIAEMNRLGMLVDLSHVTPEAMHQGLDASKAPVIFSHSSARALTDHPRNVPDDVLRRLPKEGGVVMVTFVPSYVSRNAGDWGLRNLAEQQRLREQYGSKNDPRIENALRVWGIKNPRPRAKLSDVADHIEHIANVAGHDHVGLGGDFDGISDVVEGLEDVSTYPALLAELARRGWSDENLRKLCGENLLAVWRDAERVAGR
ncbi:MAG: membrane dipeptidase [Planctomycetes bacterium]|nr:membrane dipeptidase [Planctomycetota bacterium]